MRETFLVFLLLVLAGCDAIGGGETVIQGNDNIVVTDDVVDRVAGQLAAFETTPTVTDEELAAVYSAIHRSALEGDLKASLVLLRIAAIQRRPEEPEE